MSAPAALKRGFLFLIDKPGGLTSHDVVERVRKTTGEKRIGHSGTLDPMATGLLLLCAGDAARLQSFFTKLDKSYEGTIRLGRATTTYDREGEAVGEDRDATGVRPDQIEAAAAAFRGEFLQSPPAYSAKKVGGRKFYEMARRGETVPSLPKTIRVAELTFGPLDVSRLPFSIACTSGTYIRSIAHDLGEKLGCGAHLETLRRTRIGPFDAKDTVPLDRFEDMAEAERLAPPHAVPLAQVPFPFERIRLASLESWKVRKGQSIPARGVTSREGDWVTLLGPTEEMVALGQVTAAHKISLVKPKIVFAE